MLSMAFIGTFAREYVAASNEAFNEDNWDDINNVRRDAQYAIREMQRIVKAVDVLKQHGVSVG